MTPREARERVAETCGGDTCTMDRAAAIQVTSALRAALVAMVLLHDDPERPDCPHCRRGWGDHTTICPVEGLVGER